MPNTAIAFDLGGRYDESYNEAVYSAAAAWAEETGGSYGFIETQSEAQRELILTRFAHRGYDRIISVGFGFDEAVEEVAPQFPSVSFAAIGGQATGTNVTSYQFDLSAMLEAAGYLAAQASETGRIGFIGGMSTPQLIAASEAYRAGAEAGNPAVIVDIEMTGDTPTAWNDPVRGAELAADMIDGGVDVLVSPAGGTTRGVLQYASDNGVKVIGVDMYTPGGFSDVMITSFYPDWGSHIPGLLSDETIASGTVMLDFENGGIDYLLDIENDLFTQSLRRDLAEFTNDVGAAGPSAGADSLPGTDGGDIIRALAGEDTIAGLGGNDLLDGGQGNDDIRGNQGNDTIYGRGANDRIDGGVGNDSIEGNAGADTILGGAGYDTLRGGDGDDRVVGGNGADLVYLGGGADLFLDNGQAAAHGNDTIHGNAGADTVSGGGGNDHAFGGQGNDRLLGRAGNDRLDGGAQNDTMFGGNGNDTITGGNGADEAALGNGNDIWIDNAQVAFGDDVVFGGNGNDTLRMGGGNDTVSGGAGQDVFIFSERINSDTITDFQLGIDELRIDSELWNGDLTQTRLDALSETVSGTLVLRLDEGHSITLSGLTSSETLLDDIVLI
ncbi:BMP family ABC transporter substrate-binding protein [Citreicella sp. C3M06]|uniref:BMP family ABC transporter substrate-binding protein n=1 Tax=Citreicella sp. C3M06 TaxID=2841564 RepID=UPI001C0A4A67|nr:BMP family ABC transporter substrate-binding protein [Citreicella sp. C3M06]MBU2960783.1 BMP family ABC transporter substrate-binding protein [Citreicella sp. C3M06]